MSKVRLRISGGLAFTANLIGYLTGFLFTIFVTRKLTEEEFGIWALINSLFVYALTPYDLVGGWISRDAARGRKVLESALALSGALIPISLTTYFFAGTASALAVRCDVGVMLLGLLVLVPYLFMITGKYIQGGYAPQNVGLSEIIFEFSKVIFAFFIVVVFRFGLVGALMSISLAYALQAGMLLYKSIPLSQKSIRREWIVKWVKGAPINTINVLNNILSATNVVLLGVALGQAVVVGYWQAAISAAALVTSTKFLARGLGARLISGGSQKDIDKAFSFSMMLAMPMLFGFMVLSRDLLWILRPAYSSAWIAACILAVAGIVRAVGNIGATILTGTDRFDQRDELTIKDYLHSRIFLVNKLRVLLTGLNVLSVGAYLIGVRDKVGIVDVVTAVAIINMVYAILGAVINLKLVRKLTELRLKFTLLKPYIMASIIMMLAVYLVRNAIGPLSEKIFEAAPPILLTIGLGSAVYFGALYLISGEFRSLLKDVKAFLSNYGFENLF